MATDADEILDRFTTQLRIMYPATSESWESTAVKSLHGISDFLGLQTVVEHGRANQLIIACMVLGCLQLTDVAKQCVIQMIRPLCADWRHNEYAYSRFQCEDDEPGISVSYAASIAIERLMQG